MDAIVAERLSSSPRTFDLFGFCALSILSEYFYHDDIESVVAPGSGYMKAKDLHDEDELKPQNDLTAPQKLALALEMAEGLADLHGYSGGLIIHDDVQLSQYLFAFWDEANQEYCRYENGRGGGNVSSRFGFRRVFWIVSNSGVFPWRSGGLLRSTRIGL
jgi:hypothetical protein